MASLKTIAGPTFIPRPRIRSSLLSCCSVLPITRCSLNFCEWNIIKSLIKDNNKFFPMSDCTNTRQKTFVWHRHFPPITVCIINAFKAESRQPDKAILKCCIKWKQKLVLTYLEKAINIFQFDILFGLQYKKNYINILDLRILLSFYLYTRLSESQQTILHFGTFCLRQ